MSTSRWSILPLDLVRWQPERMKALHVLRQFWNLPVSEPCLQMDPVNDNAESFAFYANVLLFVCFIVQISTLACYDPEFD